MDALYEIVAPHLRQDASTDGVTVVPQPTDPQTAAYLNRLSTLSLSDLTINEPASLTQSAQSHVRNLQALSKRSHKAVISSSAHLDSLQYTLPSLVKQSQELRENIPGLENAATEFARKYDRSTENAVLDRRKRAMLLSRNVDRVSDVLDLPSLLSSTVAAAQAASQSSASSAAGSFASALDLNAHVRRLAALYPQSELVAAISKQAGTEIQNLTSILITSLQSPNLKLAAAMRTVGWLRRVVPELTDDSSVAAKTPAASVKSLGNAQGSDGPLGALFLACRLHTLHQTLDALEPLRDLADQESARRKRGVNGNGATKQTSQSSALGSQSERYVKRYVEIFREQCFNIISMYRSIFPNGLPSAGTGEDDTERANGDPLLPLPSPVASFALHLVEMLSSTLKQYLSNVTDKSARESLLTQVLYCAGSLGRLGADFGMFIAVIESEIADEMPAHSTNGHGERDEAVAEPEWAQVLKKHRIQAGRLEVLARGVGSGRKVSGELHSPTATPA